MHLKSSFYCWLVGKGSDVGSQAVLGWRVLGACLIWGSIARPAGGVVERGPRGAQSLRACGGWWWWFHLGLACTSWPALSCEGVEDAHRATVVTAFQLTCFVSRCDFTSSQVSRCSFFLQMLAFWRFLVFNELIFEINKLFFSEFCLTFFCSFWLCWHLVCRQFITK